MTPVLAAPSRRSLGKAALWLALAGLVGCAGMPPTVFYSHVSYDRTFDTALGAMADQKLIVGQSDRRQGSIVGMLDGDTISATLQPQYDGTIRVTFKGQGESAAGAGLLKRVVDSYQARVSQARIIPKGLL